MSKFIHISGLILVMVVAWVNNSFVSAYGRASEYLKEDIEIAAHDAALQIDIEAMSNGKLVIDPIKARQTFEDSIEMNTGMKNNDYKVLTFEIFDDSNSIFPLEYEHPIYDVDELFFGPTVFVIVETSTNKYFNTKDKTIKKQASYSYNLKNDTLKSINELTISQNIKNEDGMFWPVPFTQNISSEFGYRVHPITGVVDHHNGVDIAASGIENEPAVSILDGNVIYSGFANGYGNLVIINHSNGLQSRYGHLNSVAVKVGDKIKGGQLIGYIGSTGDSTGPHLHFEMRIDNQLIDPMLYY